jgi:hypothetical protein
MSTESDYWNFSAEGTKPVAVPSARPRRLKPITQQYHQKVTAQLVPPSAWDIQQKNAIKLAQFQIKYKALLESKPRIRKHGSLRTDQSNDTPTVSTVDLETTKARRTSNASDTTMTNPHATPLSKIIHWILSV